MIHPLTQIPYQNLSYIEPTYTQSMINGFFSAVINQGYSACALTFSLIRDPIYKASVVIIAWCAMKILQKNPSRVPSIHEIETNKKIDLLRKEFQLSEQFEYFKFQQSNLPKETPCYINLFKKMTTIHPSMITKTLMITSIMGIPILIGRVKNTLIFFIQNRDITISADKDKSLWRADYFCWEKNEMTSNGHLPFQDSNTKSVAALLKGKEAELTFFSSYPPDLENFKPHQELSVKLELSNPPYATIKESRQL